MRPGYAQRISCDHLRSERFTDGWRVVLPGGKPLATPAVCDGRVYVGGGFGSYELYCLDARSGQAIWGLRISDDGPSAASVADGFVAFGTESCTLFVVDAATGALSWARWLGDPLLSQPAIRDRAVFMAHPSNGMHALSAFDLATGSPRWSVPIRSDVISAPIVSGDSVYASTFDGTVQRHRVADGSLVYARAMSATSAPWIERDEIHVAQRQQRIEGFTTVSGRGEITSSMRSSKAAPYLDPSIQSRSGYDQTARSSDAAVGFASGAPAASKSTVAAANVGQATVRGLWEYQGSRPLVIGKTRYATHGASVSAMAIDSNHPQWEHRLDGQIEAIGGHLGAPPSYANGALAIATVAGTVVLLDAITGRSAHAFWVGQAMRFQPAIVDGWIYVGTTDGSIAAIDTGDRRLDGWPMWGGGPAHNGGSK
jgi:Ca-activated chloride channel family protein